MQVSQCEQFIARAQKLLVARRGANSVGQPSRQNQFTRHQIREPSASLQLMVNAFQSERDALAAQVPAEKTGLSRRAGNRELVKGRPFLQCRL